MLCKHEVVGSIPTGSTSLCPSGRCCWYVQHRPRDNTSHLLILTGITEGCVLSDIVKRRSIRVGSCNEMPPRKRSAFRLCTDAFTISGSFRRKTLHAAKHDAVKRVSCCK